MQKLEVYCKHNFGFLGDHNCFVFTLKPFMAVYHPTGINNHFMYLNVGMKTIPNGLVSDISLINIHVCNSEQEQHC